MLLKVNICHLSAKWFLCETKRCSQHKNIIEEVKLSSEDYVKSEDSIQINKVWVQGSQQRQSNLQGLP